MLASIVSKNPYLGDGSTKIYDYDFKIFDRTHLLVTVADTFGEETTLIIDVDYSISGVGEDAGGMITLLDNGQDWINGSGFLKSLYPIALRRNIPFTQGTDLRNQGDYYPETLEDRLDYQTMIDQQLQDQYARSFKIPETIEESDIDTVIGGDLEPFSILSVNAAGNGFDFRTASEFVAANEGFLLIAYNLADLDDPEEALENLGLTATAAELNQMGSVIADLSAAEGDIATAESNISTLQLGLPAGDDYLQLQEQGSSVGTPSSGFKRIFAKTDGKVYSRNSAGVVRELGSGGGAGAIEWYFGDANAPIESVLSNGLKVWSFGTLPDEQEVFCKIPVPESYVAGTQILFTGGIFCGDTNGNTDNVWFKTATYIFRSGQQFAAAPVAYDSTNSIGSANGYTSVALANLDLTNASGQINSVAVAPLDILLVKLYRDTSAEDAGSGVSYPYNVYFLKESLQARFTA